MLLVNQIAGFFNKYYVNQIAGFFNKYYVKKKVDNEVDFWHADKHEVFCKLILSCA